jgi:hypothetical protein
MYVLIKIDRLRRVGVAYISVRVRICAVFKLHRVLIGGAALTYVFVRPMMQYSSASNSQSRGKWRNYDSLPASYLLETTPH